MNKKEIKNFLENKNENPRDTNCFFKIKRLDEVHIKTVREKTEKELRNCSDKAWEAVCRFQDLDPEYEYDKTKTIYVVKKDGELKTVSKESSNTNISLGTESEYI